MLKEANESHRGEMLHFCKGSVPGAYLACRLLCYGFSYPFVRFWVGESGGRLNAVIGSLDGNAVVCTDETADFEELRAFLQMLGFSSVMADAALAQRIGLDGFKIKQTYRYAGSAAEALPVQHETNMKSLYALISEAIPGSFSAAEEAYLSFLSDFTFRRNRSFARLCAAEENETLCACALTAAETDDAAVISGVACRADKRGKGFGKRIVLSLCGELQKENKNVYVIALNEAAQGFYEAIGFKQTSRIALWEKQDHV